MANVNNSLAACRDAKLMNVSDVKASDEERIRMNRVASEIVIQALHPDTGAPLYEGACHCSSRGVEFTP